MNGLCFRTCTAWLLSVAVILCACTRASAHTPHHTIDALEVVSTQAGPNVFVVRGGWQLFRSSDRGTSWRELSHGLTSRYQYTALTSHELSSGIPVLFVGTDGDGVYRSEDAGSSWLAVSDGLGDRRIRRLLVNEGADQESAVFAMSEAGTLYQLKLGESHWTECRLPSAKISTVAVLAEPDENKNSQLAIGTDDGEVWVADTGCDSWRRLASLDAGNRVTSIARLPGSVAGPAVLLIGTDSGALFAGENMTTGYDSTGLPPDAGAIQSIRIIRHRIGQATILVSCWDNAVFRSTDGAESWLRHSDGLSTHSQAESPAFFSPQFREIESVGGSVFMAGFDGLFRSDDDGRTWRQLVTEPPGNLWSLAVSPNVDDGHQVALTTFDTGVYLAHSQDLKWRSANRGHGVRRLRELVFSPNYASDGMVFTTQDEGDVFLRSANGGEDWSLQRFDRGLYTSLKLKVLGALRHRLGMPEYMSTDLITRDERIAANPKGLVVSPAFRGDPRVIVSTRFRGNYESRNAGLSLESIESPGSALWELAISPEFERDQTLFGSSRERGLFRSRDEGATWHPINRGLSFLDDWAEFLRDSERAAKELGQSMFYDIKLALSPGYASDGMLFAGGGPGLFRSLDRGDRWMEVSLPSNPYVMALALSPEFPDDETVLVSVKGRGLWRSVDGGASFAAFAPELLAHNQEVRHIRFSPDYARDRTIYAASQEYLFRSTDTGRTWAEIDRPVRYENSRKGSEFGGNWEEYTAPELSGGSAHRLVSSTGDATFRFVGTGVRWIGPRSPSNLAARIWIDGVEQRPEVSPAASLATSDEVRTVTGLRHGEHLLKIQGAAASAGNGLVIDAFDVLGSRRPAFESF